MRKSMKISDLIQKKIEGSEKLIGGRDVVCCCGCHYEGQPGGSSTADNRDANYEGGLSSPGCD